MTADAVGGVWQYAIDLSRALGPLGWDVTLATLGPAPDRDQRAAASALPNLELHVTDQPLDWLEQGAAPVLRAADSIAALAAAQGCDVVQLNMPTLAAGERFTVPTVAVTHGCVATWWAGARGDPLAPQYQWHARLMRQGLTRADAVVAPSHSYARMVASHYALDQNPAVVRNGRDAPAAPEHPALQDYVLTVGRLWDRAKNIDTLDIAAGQLAVPFHAAGALVGPHGERAATRHIHPLGQLSGDALATWRAPRPVFVSAARFEPFGLSVLEAAQSGCALVLSDIPTFRELWDGVAVFVDAEDASGFRHAIEGLIGNPARRHAMGEAALEHARQYRCSAAARDMDRIFTRLMADSARRAAA
jgi:glycosyltransferase involved in cell wall biosynthesis